LKALLGRTLVDLNMVASHRPFILVAAVVGVIRLVGSFQLSQNHKNVHQHWNRDIPTITSTEYVPRAPSASLLAVKDVNNELPKRKQDGSGTFQRNGVSILRSIQTTAVSLALGLTVFTGGGYLDNAASAAADPNAIVGCLFQKCAVPLAKCIASPKCLANVVCINTCNDRPDEIDCQIRCGDIFDNPVIAEFNKCAVSDMSCVPQQPDNGQYPVPSPDVTVPKFNTNFFNGRLYITAGTLVTFGLSNGSCSVIQIASLFRKNYCVCVRRTQYEFNVAR
jgi:VDE lipocalin domain